MKMIISFNGAPDSEIENQGVIQSVSWSALMPTIETFVRLRPDEVINGLVINDTDIRVNIGRKRGRKNGQKTLAVKNNDQEEIPL